MRWVLIFWLLLIPLTSIADTLRVGVYNTGLSRKGPGLLYRDIVEDRGEDIAAVISVIQEVRPDILLLLDFDFDAEGRAVTALTDRLAKTGNLLSYPYWFARLQNSGVQTNLDLDGDGKDREPEDALGYGWFAGDGAMALISRYPFGADEVEDFVEFLWRDLRGADLPTHSDGTPFPREEAQRAMRLASKSFWRVPVDVNGQQISILASHASPPVFDGPEDANGKRNKDEIRFWSDYLAKTDLSNFVLLAGLNADPNDGDGAHGAVRDLLKDPKLQDPLPRSDGAAAATETNRNKGHKTDHALDTVSWRSAGNLRVDYVLPSIDLKVQASGVFWPKQDDPLVKLLETAGSAHRLVWVDIALP